jgi:hypothetical protein
LEDPPIITSATYQHTLYNGRNQPIEALPAENAARAPVPYVIAYYTSLEAAEKGAGGLSEAPVEVGDYYARIERPAGRGYKEGRPVIVEYHIQKAMVDIKTGGVQRFRYDGKPKSAAASAEVVTLEGSKPEALELEYAYFSDDSLLAGPPSERGAYRVHVSYPGSERLMGASKDLSLIIE